MSMDAIDEPSKWVCRLSTMFGKTPSQPLHHLRRKLRSGGRLEKGTVPSNGTGFLVNLPYTKKFCIMTAGHNLKDPVLGHAISVEVIFPNKLTFTATPGEFSVSKIYHENTTTDRGDESSISDYGLIFVDREKYKSVPGSDLGGCAFSILHTKSELFRMEVTVHGHKGGEEQQTKNTSPLSRVEFDTLFYFKRTEPGVSGGPVFISRDGTDIAVGIQSVRIPTPSR
jgi:V8-like Glu-specific endopeptidase